MSRAEELRKQIEKGQRDRDIVIMKNCPICGALPELIETNLDRGNGHGYPGWFTYSYKCPCCGLLKGGSYTYEREDKSLDREGTKAVALKDWNELTDYINELIDETRGEKSHYDIRRNS